jgi:hypothetical protein
VKIVKAHLEDEFHSKLKSLAALEGHTLQDLIEGLLRTWVAMWPGKRSTPNIKLPRGK